MDVVLDPHERFAVVIADPPWVPRADTGRYPEDPVLAIDGGDDGLDLARACWVSPTATCSTAGRRCCSSARSSRCARLADETGGRSRLRVAGDPLLRARACWWPSTPDRETPSD